jgi:predicted dehydrogenase
LNPINVGIIGCGNVSSQYLKAAKFFQSFQISALADLELSRAEARAAEYGVKHAMSVDDLLASDVDLIINLTIPDAHARVSKQILDAGKAVYSEKPLGTVREDAKPILDTAESKGLRVGCAPDTFLGAGLQTSRKVIDDGWIGEPLGASAFMTSRGMEMWHPDPTFFYQPGAGPLFDVGVYYVTALVHLLGPVAKVAGTAKTSFAERTVTSQPNFGAKIPVNTPTHISGLLSFESGAVGTLMTTFDVWASELPRLELYGSEGTLSVPDPNTFGGPVRIKRAGARA